MLAGSAGDFDLLTRVGTAREWAEMTFEFLFFVSQQDGGSESGEASTEGSSAGSVYCTLEQDYARVRYMYMPR